MRSIEVWPLKVCLALLLLVLAQPVTGSWGPASAKPLVSSDLTQLPDRVGAMREAILEAARSGDIEAMRPVLESNELMPNVSFGGEQDPIMFWRESSPDGTGQEILAVLVNILSLPYVRTNPGTSNEMYIWPYLHTLDPAKLTPPQQVDVLRLMSPAEAKTMREVGSGYIWYRLGIGRDGTWHFFLAGD